MPRRVPVALQEWAIPRVGSERPSFETLMDWAHLEGWIYFIRAGKTRRVKIGWARNPVKRLDTLQVANPSLLTIIGAVPGGKRRERDVQAYFDCYRENGEWFRFHPEMMDFIRAEGFDCSSTVGLRFIDIFPEYAR